MCHSHIVCRQAGQTDHLDTSGTQSGFNLSMMLNVADRRGIITGQMLLIMEEVVKKPDNNPKAKIGYCFYLPMYYVNYST
jgi:hypothetical protein